MAETSKNKQTAMVLAILLAIAEALFITVKLSSDGPVRSSAKVNVEINERLARVEETVIPMRGLPQQVAVIGEAVKGIQVSQERIEKNQDRIEKKVDDHVSGKR